MCGMPQERPWVRSTCPILCDQLGLLVLDDFHSDYEGYKDQIVVQDDEGEDIWLWGSA